MDGVKHFKQGNRQKRFDAQRKHGGLGGHTETKKSKFWSARFNTLHQHNLNNRPNKKRTGVLETAGNPRASCKGHWNAVQKAVYIERPVKAARRSASKYEMVHLALQNAKVFPDYVEDPHFPQAEMSDEHIVFEKTGTSEFVHVFEPTAVAVEDEQGWFAC